MKHLTTTNLDKIKVVADDLAELEKGCRNRVKKNAATKIDLIPKYSRECSKLPNKYGFLYKQQENLGTKQYSDFYTEVYYDDTTWYKSMRETEKSYIFETYSGYKKIISKDKLLAFVW